MRSLFPLRIVCGLFAGAAMLGACSTGGSQLPAAGANSPQNAHRGAAPRHSWMAHVDSSTRLVYVGDDENNEIMVFNQKTGKVVGEITESSGIADPQGLFVDASHNLWVVNGANGGSIQYRILMFPRGSTTRGEVLSDPDASNPMDLTICRNGTTYVTNNENFSTGTGSIEVYAPGSTSPTGTLVFPNVAYEYFVTCDSRNNVFTDITNQYFSNDVVEFKKGKQSGATDLNVSLNNPGAIKVDNAGNLLIDDQGSNTIAEYTKAGSPTGASITLTGNVFDFAVSRSGAFVGGSDLYKGGAFVWSWPGGSEQSTQYVNPNPHSLNFGFAFDPGQRGFGG
ncbi:MAG TPA: hypothetical protein VHT92_07690 [Candidatus Cybelea sp.]|jgi:hypothetical protein|nr:hypothetical protein [Candidatus Cybelea sp.]